MDKKLKTSVMLMGLLIAGNAFLSACSIPIPETRASEETTTEITETVPDVTEETAATTTKEPWSIPSFESTTEETTIDTSPNGKDTTPYGQITLDGVKDHRYKATDYCYIESEKFVFFLEKDIEVPGDLVVNLNAILDEIEDVLQISYAPDDYTYSRVPDMSIYYGFNPWQGWDIGRKIPIFLIADYKGDGFISGASDDYVILVDYDMFSDELWNSVPGFRDNPWRRSGYVDYLTAAHEITHTVTSRNCTMTSIITEGVAEYSSEAVITTLAEYYPSITEVAANRSPYDYPVPEAVNAGNAEQIFLNDYIQLSHAERGPQYNYGRRLCEFLSEQYGKDFFKKYCAEVKARGLDFDYGHSDETIRKLYTEAFKSVFGDDVFTKFGNWCVKNKVLQDVG